MMKKLSLRILATLMALMLIVGLTACGGTGGVDSEPVTESSQAESEISAPESDATTTADQSGDTTTSKTKRSTAVSSGKAKTWEEIKAMIPASAKGTTLRVYDWNPMGEVPGMEKVVKNFEKETGIKIKYDIVTYSSYFTKITSEVAAKNAPDAVRLQNLAKQNLINLQPFNSTGYDFTDPAWDKTIMDAYTFNGNLYGVNMVDSPYYSAYVVHYNTRLIETYGLDDPYELWKNKEWTWDKLWDMCKEFLKEADGQDFIGLSTMADMSYQIAYNKPTITYNKKANTFSHNLKDDKYIKSWQLYASYYEKGYISQALTNNDAFNAGQLLFNISHTIATRTGSAYFKEIRSEGAVACVPLPALEEGSKDYQKVQELQAFGIPKTAKNANLVPYFLRYYFDVDNYNMDKFYNVDNAAEVIKYIQGKNPDIGYECCVMTTEQTGFDPGQYLNALKGGGSANVKMTLDGYVPTIEAAIKEAQAFYASL